MTEQQQESQSQDNEIYKNPEKLSDKELAEEYKSFYTQIQNDMPYGLNETTYLRQLRNEMASREHLEVFQTVRVLNEDEEVLVE